MGICLTLTVLLTACTGGKEDTSMHIEKGKSESTSVTEGLAPTIEEKDQDTQEIYCTEYITIQKVGEMPADLKYNFMPNYIYVQGTEAVPVLNENGNETAARQIVTTDYQVYNEWGKPIDMTDYSYIHQGIIIREREDEFTGEYCTGYYDTDGKEIFKPCSSRHYALEPDNKKYLVIEVRENEVNETEEWFDKKNERYYAGYAIILDLQKRKILDNLVIRSNKENFYGIGDNIIIEEWETDNFKIYDENGIFLKKFTRNEDVTYRHDSFFIYEYHYSTRTTDIYDEDGEYLFTTDKKMRETNTEDVLVFEEEDRKGCVDKKGNIIMQPEFDLIENYSEGLYTAVRILNGADYLYTYFTKAGILAQDVDFYDVEEYGVCKIGNSYVQDGVTKSLIWILKDNAYGEITGQFWGTVMGLGLCISQDGNAGLIDFNSGEQLLPQEYENIKSAFGRIYAEKDGVYSIFEVTDFHWPVNIDGEFMPQGSIAIQTSMQIGEEAKGQEQGTEEISMNYIPKLSERNKQSVDNFKVLADINSGLILYVPNKDKTGIVCEPWNNGQLSTNYIILELYERGILPQGADVNNSIGKKPMVITVNDEFKEYLLTLTPEEEDLVIASVAFSIGANWGSREVTLMQGKGDEILVTNNYVYDVPLSPDYYYELFE